jgi:hypothetical protein
MDPIRSAVDDCSDPLLREALTAYVFGELDGERRETVALHLVECELCWREFERLQNATNALRFDPALDPLAATPEVFSMLGLSGRLEQSFGGHLWSALGVSLLYGLMWAVGIWTELVYSYQQFGALAWRLFLPVGVASFASVLFALWWMTRAAQRGHKNGLAQGTTIVLAALTTLVIVAMIPLPEQRTIQASFQTRTSSAGYFKDALLVFLPLLLFIIPTFHTIVQLQRELAQGRYSMVLDLLSRRPESVVPRGMLYLPSQGLLMAFVGLGVLRVLGANNMLDALTPGPYAHLFALTTYAGVGLWLVMGWASWVWYRRNLNELKREAVVVASLLRSQR